MPIFIKQNIDPVGEIGVWKIEEDVAFFEKDLLIYPEELENFKTLKERKKLEWLSSRYLLHMMSGRDNRGAVLKDKYGKPFLHESEWNISLSHSRDLAAIIACPYLVGIDIQYIVPKISRIAPKFMSAKEFDHIDSNKELEYYHFIWGAKECLFKAYGKGNVDFKKDLHIDSITLEDHQLKGTAHVLKDDFEGQFRLDSYITEQFVLVYAIKDE